MTRVIDKAIKRITLGDPELHQSCTVGMPDPQLETRLWLEGLGDPLDITNNHVVACASPFTVGIGLNREQKWQAERSRPSVKFRKRDGDHRLLAKVTLRTAGTVIAAGQELSLFHVRGCDNYCRPRPLLFAYELYNALERWRRDKNPEIRMSILGARSMSAFFICPRPVVLVSATDGQARNIFPMNLLGCIGEEYFAFALNSLRKAAPLVKRAGRIALSSIPLEHAGLVRQLGKNHRLESTDWDRLPFTTRSSTVLGLPVPPFALRVREMQIEVVRELGSHTLFFARLLHDERLGDDLQFCMIHGIYQAWRLSMLRRSAG
jgi:flavin reductase (DIM6/NTAB) family NADH-FMN oxidoreductase RutF